MQQQTLDVSQPVPRVNAELMSSFIGKRVRLVGKVDSIDGPTTVNLRAADNGPVSASLALALPEEALNKVVELEGMVETVNTLSGASYVIFGDNFGE